MSILKDKDKEEIRNRLKAMTGKVKLVYFTQELECQFCRETGILLNELAELSDLLEVETFNFVNDKEVVEKYKVDKIPAVVMLDGNDKDYGIRFYGIPSGYEFATLLEDILMVSSGQSGLSSAIIDELAKLENDVHMQVFVTPTCPYCPGAVLTAHKMAFESDKVSADMVEATEFPHLSNRYNVRGVPRTVVNEEHTIEGMVPESKMLSEVMSAAHG